ncbi:MAG: alpha-L-rhamnosidase C-terminal domain-containing protein, partial [Bacillota bacterium]
YTLLNQDTFPSWLYSIKQGATTIWERWDGWTKEKGFQDPGMNSFNHYSLGSVGEWMFATVAGIDLDAAVAGYKHVVIRPLPGGGLTYAKGQYKSMYGTIASSWKVSGGKLVMDVTVPVNTTATVYVPNAKGAAVSESGKAVEKAAGVTAKGIQGGASVFEVGAGTYRFEVAK